MPNHVSTNLRIVGNQKDVEAFVEAIKSAEAESGYDFSILLPVPPELLVVGSPTRILTGGEYAVEMDRLNNLPNGSTEKQLGGKPITQAMADDYQKRFGATNWYDWRVKNYGTKWNLYNITFSGLQPQDDGLCVAEFSYYTAWSPATQYFINVSEQFPELTFTHEFADEGGGFVGEETIANGVIQSQTGYDWDSDDGIKIRDRVGYYYPEDDSEEVCDVM